ncbi:MAG: hypothetical protein VX589_10010 [Myxococcota bacterium]|nr:hypothetical protein [Myxococcota bacterium]
MPASDADAQSLDVNVDAAVGMGLQLTTVDSETEAQRTSAYIQVDMGFIFDEDPTIEWVLGTITQVESPQALALNPKVRIVKDTPRWRLYATLGVPWYVVPFRRFGAELGGGVISPLSAGFALISGLTIQTLFAGADIPDDTAVLVFGASVGGRVAF